MNSCVAIKEIIRRTSARPTLRCPSVPVASAVRIPVRTNAEPLGSITIPSDEYKSKPASPLYVNRGRVAPWSSRRMLGLLNSRDTI